MNLIQITDTNNVLYMINVDHIVHLSDNENGTTIKLVSGQEILTNRACMSIAERLVSLNTNNIQHRNILND